MKLTVRVSAPLVERIDRAVERGEYKDRSKAVRDVLEDRFDNPGQPDLPTPRADGYDWREDGRLVVNQQ